MPVRRRNGGWQVDIRHQGKRLRMRCPGTTRADAQAYETYLRGELAKHGTLDHLEQSGRPATASVPTVGEFVGRFLAEYVDANNGVWERHTKRRILSTVLLPAFRDTPLDRIRSSDVERFKAASVGAGRSAKTINNHLSVLRTMLAMAVEWEIIPALPRIRFMKLPEMRPDFLSDMEVETLLAHANPTMRLMVRCAVDTGVREGELTALQWRDVNLERGTLTIQRAWARKTLKPPKNAGHAPYRSRPYSSRTCARQRAVAAPRRPTGSSRSTVGRSATRPRAGACTACAPCRACAASAGTSSGTRTRAGSSPAVSHSRSCRCFSATSPSR